MKNRTNRMPLKSAIPYYIILCIFLAFIISGCCSTSKKNRCGIVRLGKSLEVVEKITGTPHVNIDMCWHNKSMDSTGNGPWYLLPGVYTFEIAYVKKLIRNPVTNTNYTRLVTLDVEIGKTYTIYAETKFNTWFLKINKKSDHSSSLRDFYSR